LLTDSRDLKQDVCDKLKRLGAWHTSSGPSIRAVAAEHLQQMALWRTGRASSPPMGRPSSRQLSRNFEDLLEQGHAL